MMSLKRKNQEPEKEKDTQQPQTEEERKPAASTFTADEIPYQPIDLDRPYRGELRTQDSELGIAYGKAVANAFDARRRRQQP